ncbi:MAG: DNA replication/repair protein RecF [Gammaproteobacteria bacterium]
MTITALSGQDFRNFTALQLECSPRLNLIVGSNGTGKTNLLELIHFLGRTRSFRTHQGERLIRYGQDRCMARGTVVHNGSAPSAITVQRDRKGVQIRHAQQTLKTVAELAPWFPIQVIGPESHQLLQGGPQYRRRYLDWGVFHVEQGFFPSWQRYSRALQQRNAALRKGASAHQIRAWDGELEQTAGEIDGHRRSYLRQLSNSIGDIVRELLDVEDLTLEYRPGWPCDQSLTDALARFLERDRERGFTHYGPHRADLAISVGGRPARDWISRGQQKLLVISLLLAQAQAYSGLTENSSLLLVDDLAAELDHEYRMRAFNLLIRTEAQLFLTALDPEIWTAPSDLGTRMFHVEHGNVSEMV